MKCILKQFNTILLCVFIIGYIRKCLSFDSIVDVNGTQLFKYEHQLRQKLQENYNSHILPLHNYSNPVKVDLELRIIAIRELDEKIEALTLDAWFKMEWNDSRLKWNQTQYGGLDKISVPHQTIWRPDIRLYNRVKLSDIDTQADVLCSVRSDGMVIWIPPSTFHSSCNIDLKFFPFDIQTCNLTFGSWNLNGFHIEMDLLQKPGKVLFQYMANENNQWEVVGSNAYKNIKYFPCCVEPYSDVTFEIRLRRRSPYYKYTTLYPALGVAALTLVTFWLPPDAPDKIVLGAVNFLSLVLLLIHLSWKTPPAGKTVPMIVAFCGNLIMIVTTSIILSTISIIWGRAKYNRRPPGWMRSAVASLLGKLLCINSPIAQIQMQMNHVEDITSIDMDNSGPYSDITREHFFTAEWMQCLSLINRINFFIFIGVITSTLAGAFATNQ